MQTTTLNYTREGTAYRPQQEKSLKARLAVVEALNKKRSQEHRDRVQAKNEKLAEITANITAVKGYVNTLEKEVKFLRMQRNIFEVLLLVLSAALYFN